MALAFILCRKSVAIARMYHRAYSDRIHIGASHLSVVLHGYYYSVYHRIARMALLEKGVAYTIEEIDPFSASDAKSMQRLNPLGRVPVLDHDGFRIFETLTIASYVDQTFHGPPLCPVGAAAAARMYQVISIINAHAYWPLVRQVFTHRVMRPLVNEKPDEVEIAQGMARAAPVLAALEALCHEGLVFGANSPSLADLFTFPVLDYFNHAPEGAELLAKHRALSGWFDAFQARESVAATAPDLATLRPG